MALSGRSSNGLTRTSPSLRKHGRSLLGPAGRRHGPPCSLITWRAPVESASNLGSVAVSPLRAPAPGCVAPPGPRLRSSATA
eukprot:11257078-Alexandrium_andersonii.AAC.1